MAALDNLSQMGVGDVNVRMGAPAPGAMERPVRYLKGVGNIRAALLERLGIRTVGDLLHTLPHRHEDRRRFTRLADLRGDETALVSGEILSSGWIRPRRGPGFFEALLKDDSGFVRCRWFNAPYLQDQLRPGRRLVLYGKVGVRGRERAFIHPEFEPLDEEAADSIHVGRIVPIYRLTENLSQRTLRRIVWRAVNEHAGDAAELLPSALRERLGFPGISEALRDAHFPDSLDAARRARRRLVFEEFLCVQLVLAARKAHAEKWLTGIAHLAPGHVRHRFVGSLPFRLTAAQQRVLGEIAEDMRKPHPMHRLLQGDVGSGKTVVAACAILDAIECGSQCAVLAPTEILAAQHEATFRRFLEPVGVRTVRLVGGQVAAERQAALEGIRGGDAQLVVGTHALLSESVVFRRLGLVVIDEQHKFGVEQRGVLYGKGVRPDVLVMTATPIPRTLAMTVYGDLDVSILDEMPPGRGAIVTRVIRADRLAQAYEFIRSQVKKGRQAYLIYPLVAENGAGGAGAIRNHVKSAESMFRKLREEVFMTERLALLHGQMMAEAKDAVMMRFKAGETDILVATTVIEVGIDVPNATVMLVENAERFGLAQLHQLRGRVGRGPRKSFCILEGAPVTPDAARRLEVMEETSDGFRIAEEDLQIRGMGNLLGREQSGVPAFRVGDPIRDAATLVEARAEAFRLVAADPNLEAVEHAGLRDRARALYRIVGPFVEVG
jgi:ATP-dependent DNA helicase RecG